MPLRPPLPFRSSVSYRAGAAIGIWCAAVMVGLGAMLHYELTPVPAAGAPSNWPAGSTLVRSEQQPTLLMFMHPRCPCSRASLGELLQVLEAAPVPVRLYVLFLRPSGMPAGWERTDLWTTAESIPQARVLADAAGAEAERFHVRGSGQVLLYGADGQLLFHGGITAGRGHAGVNAGRSAVAALLRGERATVRQTPVFGCSLRDSASRSSSPRNDSES